jgi:hypothetical protein
MMKSLLLFAAVLFYWAAPGSAAFEPLTGDILEEWENGLGYAFPLVQHFPLQDLSDDGSIYEVVFGGVAVDWESLDVYLIGLTGETPVLLASGSYSGRYNFAKSWACFEEIEGTVEVGFQMPGSAQWYSAYYSWDFQSGDLALVRYESGDPSLDALSEIDSLLALGEIEKAERVLGEMFYPQNYYVEAEMYCLFLRATHREAVMLCRRGDRTRALELFTHLPWAYGVPDWDGSELTPETWEGTGPVEYMTLEEYNSIVADYQRIRESAGE